MRPGWASGPFTRLAGMAGFSLLCIPGVASPTCAAEASAAQLLQFISGETFTLLAVASAAGTLLWAFLAIRKLARDELKARQRARELESELNEAEAALSAEPHVLIVWRGRNSD